MQARSALFDLYGDHLRPRGGRAAVAALVRLLAPARHRRARRPDRGVADGAAGLAAPFTVADRPGLRHHPEGGTATRRGGRPHLPHAEGRHHAGTADSISSRWTRPAPRARARLAANLGFLGYGAIDASTWIAPRPGEERRRAATEAGVRFDRFSAAHVAGGRLARRAGLGPGRDRRRVRASSSPGSPRSCGDRPGHRRRAGVRGQVHARARAGGRSCSGTRSCRRSCCRSPGRARRRPAFFDRHAGRLRPAADRYVDQCLTQLTNQPNSP